jgi:hypothetical protein
VDIPVAVIDAVNTATPVLLMVHADYLGRAFFALPTPVPGASRKRNSSRMTNSAKASVWDVVYKPPSFAPPARVGSLHSATGAQTLNTRFPGLFAGQHSASRC